MNTTEISPNEPDVMPDYVDGKPAAASAAPRKPARENAPAPDRRSPPADPAAVTSAEPHPVPPPAAATKDPAATRDAADVETAGHREGECVPNVPDVAPAVVSGRDAEAPASRPAAGRNAEPSPSAAPLWRWHLLAAVLVAGLFGVMAFSQAISALAMASSLPQWAQYALLIPLGASCLAVLWVGFCLLRAWMRLRTVHQIDVAALEELRRRAETRRDGVGHFQAARNRLESYLGAYPLSPADTARAPRPGLAAADVEALAKAREFLLNRPQDSRTWLGDFREQFQNRLDEAAARRIKAWTVRAAGCVIASPLPLLDAILVLGIAFKMGAELCSIYNVRASRAGTLVLLTRAVSAAFIAGVAEEGTEMAGGMAMGELSGLLGEGAANSLGARIAGAVAPKLGEGAINAFFIHRLGRTTVRMLQPLAPDRAKPV